MFEIANHTMTFEQLLKEEDGWYQRYTMTTEQHKQWKNWTYKKAKKLFRWNKKHIQKEFMWFDLMWGLKIKEK